jgi:hypothetical protein
MRAVDCPRSQISLALNHLFIAGTGPSTPAEYVHPGHVSQDVIQDIAAWIAPPTDHPE